MKFLEKAIDILNTILIVLAGAALLAVMALSVANVVLRLYGARFGGAYELVGFAGAIVIAASLGQTQRKKDHVPVDIITRRLPLWLNRGIDVLKYCLKLAFAVIVAWKMAAYGAKIAHSGEVSETLKMEYYPFIFAVAGGFAVLACTVLLDIVRTVMPGSAQTDASAGWRSPPRKWHRRRGAPAMSGEMLGIWGIGVLIAAMMLLKLPPGYAMAIVGFAGLVAQRCWVFGGSLSTSFSQATTLLTTDLWGSFSNYGLTVIPMFILMGELIFYAGYSDTLYQTAYRWVGHRRGGLAITSILACAGFSAICGSNTATAATMGAVAIPSMRKYKYHPTLMTGAVAAGSTLGVMIPPSIVLVVYALYQYQSIGKLFIGVLIPGMLLTALLAGTVVVICVRHPEWGPAGERSTWGQRLRSLVSVLDVLILFAAIMVAMFSGLVTATEAAAAGCFLALVICLLRGKLRIARMKAAMHNTLRITCMVFMIVAGAVIFGRFMTISGLPQAAAEWIGSLSLPGWSIVAIMLAIYALGGCLMDALAFLLISLPIFFPLAERLGYDPVWFGVVLCLVTTLGAITPPVGICCFVIAGMNKDIPMEQVFRGAVYYMPAYILTVVLMFLLPYWMVTMLANLVR